MANAWTWMRFFRTDGSTDSGPVSTSGPKYFTHTAIDPYSFPSYRFPLAPRRNRVFCSSRSLKTVYFASSIETDQK